MATLVVDLGRLDRRRRDRDVASHEAAHCAAAMLLGFAFDKVELDPRGELEWLGQVDGLRDPQERHERDPFRALLDRSVVARCGVIPTVYGTWEGREAGADRAVVLALRPASYGWEMHVETTARRLVRSEDFGAAHRAVVVALEEAGVLSGTEVEAIIARVKGGTPRRPYDVPPCPCPDLTPFGPEAHVAGVSRGGESRRDPHLRSGAGLAVARHPRRRRCRPRVRPAAPLVRGTCHDDG